MGWQINFMTCIDFTVNNKAQKLHDIHFGGENQYIEAIESIGTILEQYNAFKNYPVYGFGGFPQDSLEISNCFALNGQQEYPEVAGLQAIRQLYKLSAKDIKLKDTRTIFGETLKHIHTKLSSLAAIGKPMYHVILILAAAPPSDM
jgi:copine 5/8/9